MQNLLASSLVTLLSIATEGLRGFPLFLQAPRDSFRMFCNLLFINYPTFRGFMTWVTKSVVT
jgi:hypothetical protein